MHDPLDGTTIHSVRVRGGHDDAQSLRWRLEPMLADLEPPRPAHWPRSAIVCVRRLHDPLPGQWRAAGWSRTVRDALAAVIARAVRPAREPVPGNADAVVFFTRAEQLACLARDLAASDAARWWWRVLLRGGDPRDALLRAWLDEPEQIPATLDLLTRTGLVARAFAALEPIPADVLLSHVAARHGIPDGAVRRLAALATSASQSEPADLRTPADPAALAPVLASLAAAPGVAPPLRPLLALALALRREPGALRRAQESVLSDIPMARPDVARSSGPLPEPTARPEPPELALPVPPTDPPRDRSPARPDPDTAYEPMTRRSAPAPPQSRSPATRFDPSDTPPVTPPVQPTPVLPDRLRTDADPVVPLITTDAPASVRWTSTSPAPPLDAAFLAVETDLGGIFYLVNLVLALSLYPDFTAPMRPSLAFPLWDLLALLARTWLAPDLRPRDPVWSLLARLAGHPERDPDASVLPARWAVAPAWLTGFARGRWTWHEEHSRWVIHHPAGFVALDEPAGERPLAARLAELGLAGAYTELAPVSAPPATSAASWIDHLAAFARVRLARAMPQIGADTLVDVLLRHRATIHLSETRLDIAFSLAELPLAVRLAGLDRDIGWLPSAGLSLRFIFE